MHVDVAGFYHYGIGKLGMVDHVVESKNVIANEPTRLPFAQQIGDPLQAVFFVACLLFGVKKEP